MTRCRSQVDSAAFDGALHLHPQYKLLLNTGEPIATIKVTIKAVCTIQSHHQSCSYNQSHHQSCSYWFILVHTGPNASKASSEDASGLESVICLARGARVMLTSNLWTDAGLVNGAMGTVQAICYQSGGPPSLPVAVMVKFDKYWGPTLHDGSVPIVPQRRTWVEGGSACSRLQIPLKLAISVMLA